MKVSYKDNDPKGWCGDPKRGAALGRGAKLGDREYAGKMYLRLVPIDSGGYDPNGTYFGVGEPIYWYASVDGSIDCTLRARNREKAKAEILESYPKARFFR